MRPARLILRSLAYYRKVHFASVLGLAAATTVTTGALVIADSVKSTVKQRALGRLGKVRHALVSPRFIQASRQANATPAVILRGSVLADNSVAYAIDVQVIGIDEWFGKTFGAPMRVPADAECALNLPLARELGVKQGDGILLSVPLPADAPVSSLFGRKKPSDLRATLRLTVVTVLPDQGIGDFSLDPSPRPRRNAFVNLEWLSRQLGTPGACNALLASSPEAPSLNLSAKDCGLQVQGPMVHYDRLAFPQEILEEILQSNPQAETGSVYLVTQIAGDNGRSSSYAVVGSRSSLALKDHEVVLTRWVAEDIGARVGARVVLEWLEAQANGGYRERRMECRVKLVLQERDIEEVWTPRFKGMTNATTLDNWDPPFPFDPSRITERDEDFWKLYRAAPKA